MRRRPHSDCDARRGAATVWVLALASVVWFTALAGLLVADARALRHQAGAAADLAALAAAGSAWRGPERACELARRTASANGGRLQTCALRSGVADVTVEIPLPARFSPFSAAEGVMMRARAGPTDREIGYKRAR